MTWKLFNIHIRAATVSFNSGEVQLYKNNLKVTLNRKPTPNEVSFMTHELLTLIGE